MKKWLIEKLLSAAIGIAGFMAKLTMILDDKRLAKERRRSPSKRRGIAPSLQ